MSSHPDADAFMRGYLQNPTDVTARLVFADWLEETGKSWNRAWAYYIRLKAEADPRAPGSSERRELERQAAGYAPKIRARLTIPAALFVGYPKSLLELLPALNITVRLAGFDIPSAILEFMPESVARENLVLPLAVQGSVLLVVTAAQDVAELIQKLMFILNRDIVAVRGQADDILAAINRDYGQSELEYIDSVPLVFTSPPSFPLEPPAIAPLIADDDAPTDQLVETMLVEAIRSGAQRLRLVSTSADTIALRTWHQGYWLDRGQVPAWLGPAIASRLAEMAGVEEALAESDRAEGEFAFHADGLVRAMRSRIRFAIFGPAIDLDW
jgi:uncharacterized protein (TIGR02996 family)